MHQTARPALASTAFRPTPPGPPAEQDDTFEDIFPELRRDSLFDPMPGPEPLASSGLQLRRHHTLSPPTSPRDYCGPTTTGRDPTARPRRLSLAAASHRPSNPTATAPLPSARPTTAATPAVTPSSGLAAPTSPSHRPAGARRQGPTTTTNTAALTPGGLVSAQAYDFTFPTSGNYTLALNCTTVECCSRGHSVCATDFTTANATARPPTCTRARTFPLSTSSPLLSPSRRTLTTGANSATTAVAQRPAVPSTLPPTMAPRRSHDPEVLYLATTQSPTRSVFTSTSRPRSATVTNDPSNITMAPRNIAEAVTGVSRPTRPNSVAMAPPRPTVTADHTTTVLDLAQWLERPAVTASPVSGSLGSPAAAGAVYVAPSAMNLSPTPHTPHTRWTSVAGGVSGPSPPTRAHSRQNSASSRTSAVLAARRRPDSTAPHSTAASPPARKSSSSSTSPSRPRTPSSAGRRPREKSMLRSVASFFNSGIRRLSNGVNQVPGSLNDSDYDEPSTATSFEGRRSSSAQRSPELDWFQGGGSNRSGSRNPQTIMTGSWRRRPSGQGSRATRSARTSPLLTGRRRSVEEEGNGVDLRSSTATNGEPNPATGQFRQSEGGSGGDGNQTTVTDYPLRRHKTAEVFTTSATTDSYSMSQMRSLLGLRGKSAATSPETPPSATPTAAAARADSEAAATAARVAQVLTLPALTLQGRRPDSDVVLTQTVARQLQPALPVRLRLASTWKLLYSTSQHGISMATLFRQVQRKGPCILAIRDTQDNVFGAFLSDPLQPHPSYYGSGECFLWKAVADTTTAATTPSSSSSTTSSGSGSAATGNDGALARLTNVRVYKWKNTNEYFILTEPHFIAVGGGDGRFGLWLDGEFDQGHSATCPTFQNEPLCTPPLHAPNPASATATTPHSTDSLTLGSHSGANRATPLGLSSTTITGAESSDDDEDDGHGAAGGVGGMPDAKGKVLEAKFECFHVEVWGIVP
ncbi:oxidation resistance protein 1 [Tieghemiomyces parasiticus]|uniref:Oxidation resistance protein 1 n=1 Tax=Tieghemiomyces parasiticus TaxID=78921 RepID=A0A9W8AGW7_9FUNG|nr:oxidation resistance protein 1 [Tieghemiomyces parasiticus]